MKAAKFEDLFDEALADLYDAENQILAALPKMIAAAASAELAGAFQDHLDQTKGQVRRLQTVFESMGEEPGSKPSSGMEGLLKESERLMGALEKSPTLDLGLAGVAQKVEYYEIAGYGMARAISEILGQQETAELLQETLDEEEAAQENLADVVEAILAGQSTLRALGGGGGSAES